MAWNESQAQTRVPWMNFKQGLETCEIRSSFTRTGWKMLDAWWLCQMFWKYTLISYILNYIDWNSKLKPTYHISFGQKRSVKIVFWILGGMHDSGFEVWQAREVLGYWKFQHSTSPVFQRNWRNWKHGTVAYWNIRCVWVSIPLSSVNCLGIVATPMVAVTACWWSCSWADSRLVVTLAP